ncbi:MAG: SIS domain-containing protein, partial [Dehalococcoidia bacterium]
PQVAVCNVVGAEATRVANGSAVYLRCGPEIGVASTKTFTASMAALYLLACRVGVARGHLTPAALEAALDALLTVPSLVDRMLQQDDLYRDLAQECLEVEHLLYLGRGLQYPIALEGALKCKEVSYIHAEGYPAGEMKHGPIALIDRRTPVIALAPRDPLYDKMWSNIQQIKARDGVVLALGTEGDRPLQAAADRFIPLPEMDPLVTPFATAVPVQLIAYHVAAARGADVDQPRNLAKTVTVE